MINSKKGKDGLLHPRTWTFRVLGGIVFFLIVIIGTNTFVDAYGILRKDFSRQFREPNKHFLKIKIILENKDRFDSYLFGSSRANNIDVQSVKTDRYYNASYSEGLPQEHLNNIKLMLRHGIVIRNIMIALDDFSYRVHPSSHMNLLRQPHPEISGKSPFAFYNDYFVKFKRFFPDIRDYINYNVRKKYPAGMKIIHDLAGSGRTLCANCDEEIEKDPDRYRRDPKFNLPFHYDGDNLEDTLAAIRELVALAKKRNINLRFFINPIHQTTYFDTDMALFMQFKRGLAKITNYYDFSGLNSITTDNYYYYETSHYRTMVGDMIVARIMGTPSQTVPPDFGIMVTSSNVETHVKRLQDQIAAHNENKKNADAILDKKSRAPVTAGNK